MSEQDSCAEIVFEAKLAEQTERYDEMKENMKEVVKAKKSLSKEERNLLSVAYKNVVGARRASWRVLHSFSKSKEEGFDKQRELVDEYRRKVEDEIDDICEEILTLLEHTLLKNCQEDAEATVFYLKMMGDYLRYLAEVTEKEKRKQSADRACDAYNKAQEASTRLAPTNPIRLGLALNFSVFYYEIMNLREKACELAKNAFDLAVTELDYLDGAGYKDATLIMQLLRDNLTLWSNEDNEAGHAAPVAEDGMDVEDL
eukprot:CAMPEP_0195516254 /NCGR_PEP_ID=MMETSP0794_2-20130614/7031_1 /TAXON_ID=515487 /ORGANISM="Stephanopyxis turris, Strain CCMP 815" /LENGTH=256 /DNA_ID=CAMNT_0040644805 /DNA_START=79 /DNA_END=849 /DNA_ORIENTATION=-